MSAETLCRKRGHPCDSLCPDCERAELWPSEFRGCPEELSGLAFNAKPASWTVVDLGHGDHSDYCPQHAKLLHGVSDTDPQES